MLSIILRAAAVAVFAVTLSPAALAQPAPLRGSGSTFIAPAVEAWTAAYVAATPGATVAYRAIGSGEGVKDFMAARTHFGGTERPMTETEIALVPEGVVHVPILAGMVVVAYNLPAVTGELRLGRRTLAAVFSGAITRWDDPRIAADNPGLALPRREIALVARRDASGTSFAFASHLAAIDPDFASRGPGVSQLPVWPQRTMTAYGNEGVAGRIAIAENSIGYVEYGFARRLGISVATLQNRAGAFVAPTAASGAAAVEAGTAAAAASGAITGAGQLQMVDPEGAGSYPIVTLAWLLLRERQDAPAVALALRRFVGIALGPEGQAKAEQIGYVPLPGLAITRAQTLLDRVR